MKYKYTAQEAKHINKYGADLTVFGQVAPTASIVRISVEEGHFEEFKHDESTFIYYVIKGNGIFVLNDEQVEVKATDLIAIPPKTRIHYFGKMEMLLVVTPAFDPNKEGHVRMIGKEENPLKRR
ncbi:TPA: hypothetical protein DDW69_01935 [candidate division CPR2 bacterium]|uniref:Cupin type-2 domain-containing protein n=1 Tax=candidate division CPR2 bacterium GW2011_GWC1_41_48 TaxID=1618344 RepID=A0A0G0Z9R9_UNCC2|nr:MAG: hypothetical protein UT47_C0001G0188 [candidate division CPR2 bacterium GW2011_GWC2_39_35]KKR28522.1 MAG: hypothetical protein UT59_C0025G0009 [candidate division CPR2 bacterium GW2011_GWD1_39_7]KKR28705.1 MAG: hypothetical protein UT60_C0014G0016 [candidate division CPR2 bacterium GW2011_GWD2_39_7]KKS09783.1 MAG: hypothetical protein UU65_C0001G0188 [candidate division CPR2 bacterium GW2011_GWC1_41_48]OGB60988.1 MAG: hypothetical protein A2Y27_03440 [candidate division CPR2 bacterium G